MSGREGAAEEDRGLKTLWPLVLIRQFDTIHRFHSCLLHGFLCALALAFLSRRTAEVETVTRSKQRLLRLWPGPQEGGDGDLGPQVS